MSTNSFSPALNCFLHDSIDLCRSTASCFTQELGTPLPSYVKWLSPGSGKVDSFIDYYHEQWVNSGESNWFAGAGPIDINNGLEAINKDIKVLRFSVINRKLGHPLYMLLL